MQHGSDSGDPQQGSHRALFEDYLGSHVTVSLESGPCRDENILSRGAQVLLQHSEPEGATLTRLCQHVVEVLPSDPSHPHLLRLVRATELLETLCLNLYQQPWRKEFRNLKTFTGAFVYCLLPAIGSTTLQSILASIGYLPNEPGLSPSEYRLCEDASPDGAVQVAFQLLLTRALCLHLLQLHQHNRPSVQVCVERLQLKLLPAERSQSISTEEREANQTEEEEQDPEAPKASGQTEDQSIPHLHLTYPDLVFRGRPLVSEDDNPTLSQHTALSPHRRYAQKGWVSPSDRTTNQDITEEEGLSGPLGLSLHITLRPQTARLPTYSQLHPKADTSGICEENIEPPVKCEDEEVQEREGVQDQTDSICTEGEDLHSSLSAHQTPSSVI